jgi:hypothetical protein
MRTCGGTVQRAQVCCKRRGILRREVGRRGQVTLWGAAGGVTLSWGGGILVARRRRRKMELTTRNIFVIVGIKRKSGSKRRRSNGRLAVRTRREGERKEVWMLTRLRYETRGMRQQTVCAQEEEEKEERKEVRSSCSRSRRPATVLALYAATELVRLEREPRERTP